MVDSDNVNPFVLSVCILLVFLEAELGWLHDGTASLHCLLLTRWLGTRHGRRGEVCRGYNREDDGGVEQRG